MEQITYKQWESIDRTDLVTHTDTVDDFVEKLIDKLQTLKLHQFIHSQQTAHYYHTKENLRPSEVLVVGDFLRTTPLSTRMLCRGDTGATLPAHYTPGYATTWDKMAKSKPTPHS